MAKRPPIKDLIVDDRLPPCEGPHLWELITKFSGRFYRCKNCDETRPYSEGPDNPLRDAWTDTLETP